MTFEQALQLLSIEPADSICVARPKGYYWEHLEGFLFKCEYTGQLLFGDYCTLGMDPIFLEQEDLDADDWYVLL